ncbi:Exopolysaccharide synthesis, ExoD [Methylobrevis pamukkalensis]|uniref:Exopolysaccharide synthesis, ExoD n=1 Tax=Methylobrevis pamukkalensis TaxID=1439726 RepID=A0A1E3H164_9HYPH|nr:Exopolysaccharide synthesis, ExoD [Methylobrevis pamukkalensis]
MMFQPLRPVPDTDHPDLAASPPDAAGAAVPVEGPPGAGMPGDDTPAFAASALPPGANDPDPAAHLDAEAPDGRRHGGKLSEILSVIAGDESRERISVGDLLDVLRHRAHGALIFVFAVPNTLPTPPGTSAILARRSCSSPSR